MVIYDWLILSSIHNKKFYQKMYRMDICRLYHIFAYGGFQCHGDGSPIILYELKD